MTMMLHGQDWLASEIIRIRKAETYIIPRAYIQPSATFLALESIISRITGMASRRIKLWRITSATEQSKCSILRLPQWPSTSAKYILFGGVQKNAVANEPAIHNAVHRPIVI
jgi:hypothetical protein